MGTQLTLLPDTRPVPVRRPRRTAAEAKQKALERVTANADTAWAKKALQAVRETAQCLPEFTTDAVVKRIPRGVSTHEMRALGGVIKKACSLGYIAQTGRVQNSTERRCHGRPKAIWESRIFRKAL